MSNSLRLRPTIHFMTYNFSHIVRSICRPLNIGVVPVQRKSASLIFTALALCAIAKGQVPTVTALPQVLSNTANPYFGRVVASNTGIIQIPPAVNTSGFASLFGGGFGALVSGPTGPVAVEASALALIKVQRLAAVAKAQAYVNDFKKMTNNTQEAINEAEQNESANTAPQQEETAVQTQEQLAEASQSGEATEEVMENLEVAVEAATEAAEEAEVALEGIEDSLDVLEGILIAIDIV